jgi:hypothetical protein
MHRLILDNMIAGLTTIPLEDSKYIKFRDSLYKIVSYDDSDCYIEECSETEQFLQMTLYTDMDKSETPAPLLNSSIASLVPDNVDLPEWVQYITINNGKMTVFKYEPVLIDGNYVAQEYDTNVMEFHQKMPPDINICMSYNNKLTRVYMTHDQVTQFKYITKWWLTKHSQYEAQPHIASSMYITEQLIGKVS